MCHFMSWIESKGKLWYLTKDDIESERGKELIEYCVNKEDIIGHGAIRWFYDLSGGINRECTDFSTPKNFPPEIVNAIKAGKFEGFDTPEELLTQPAWEEYDKIEQSALDEYAKIIQSAWEEYDKIEQPAWEEYDKIELAARDKYYKIKQSARDKYNKIEQSARDEYAKIIQSAWEEYGKIEQSAKEEYNKIEQSAFWGLFADINNRSEAWR